MQRVRHNRSMVANAADIVAAGAPRHLDRSARVARRDDVVTIGLGAWLIVGLFVDGWAHNTRPLLETFFTPWHAVFYSGFAAVTAWIGWLVWSHHEPGQPWAQALPRGYLPAAAAGVGGR